MQRMSWLPGRRSALLGAVVVLVTTLGLSGCFRGHWHGRYDPARFEEHLNEFSEEVADELEITPAQRPQFDALMAKYKQVARDWRNGWHGTGEQVANAMAQQPADVDAVAAALKARIHNRPPDAELEALVDESVAFYRTLDPQQQEKIRERVNKRMKRRFG